MVPAVMRPRANSQPAAPEQGELSQETEASIRSGIEAADRGETVAMTRAELDRWAETGDFPDRIEQWAASFVSRSST